ncbi:MAG: SDR family oxidoreductase [Clostridia bacterium]|nr:SDR family oxidoreductase [Clostridia bacterium]
MNKTVLITGASRGIGCEIARKFYHAGYNVAINYNKSEKEALELAKELKGSVLVQGDVSIEAEAERAIRQTVEAFGKIDVVVNNAGISRFNLVTDISLEEWNEVFSTNVTGTFLMCKYALKEMIGKKSGSIINISSVWGVSGASCESCYSASKGAVIAFTKALAKELGPSGIRVNAIAPGFIDTDMNKNISEEDARAFFEETPLGRAGKPQEVASAALFLASEEASFITGQILEVDGGVII